MIHDEIVTYEVAKLAKEKRFPQDPKEYNNNYQLYCWDNLRKVHTLCISAMWYTGEYSREDMCAAPTQSILQRWLREEKQVDIVVMPMWRNGYAYFLCGSIHEDDGAMLERAPQPTYERTLEDALRHALENLV